MPARSPARPANRLRGSKTRATVCATEGLLDAVRGRYTSIPGTCRTPRGRRGNYERHAGDPTPCCDCDPFAFPLCPTRSLCLARDAGVTLKALSQSKGAHAHAAGPTSTRYEGAGVVTPHGWSDSLHAAGSSDGELAIFPLMCAPGTQPGHRVDYHERCQRQRNTRREGKESTRRTAISFEWG